MADTDSAETRQLGRPLAHDYKVEMARPAWDDDAYAAQVAPMHVQMIRLGNWLVRDRPETVDPDLLASVATEGGLDARELRDTLEGLAVEYRLEEQFEAAGRRGIWAGPTVAYADTSVQGAVSPENRQSLFEGAE